ncbi:MFS transporter, UMF1 family [Cribrihabitans marinus]|uniref:MFS transporter, UMF1 family n=1 Tax=Cribrihabitans marinus TaxID=1227549 RepID=A0A1H6YBD9_9RHOB|nr:MFS transporter [Cribrihabitans marinus]GGH28293.1 MFS transporter [Cribrihabitans marinus]SEJ34470.1 MFS transporter, UMF1 family [Cribrihabitans marinus]
MAEISARKRIWGWWFFDWASQPYHTLLVTFIFGPYFAGVAAQYFASTGMEPQAAAASAQSAWARCLAITGLIIAFGAPLLGAMADVTGRRMPWIFGFSVMYAAGSAALWFTMPDGSNMWLMLSAFGLGFVGAEYALVFINSQLPDLGDRNEVGAISGTGFAFGYFGGLVSLAIMLLLFVEQPSGKTLIGLDPALGLDAGRMEGTRFVGPFTAAWFVLFMTPYFLWVRDDQNATRHGSFGTALRLLGKSVANLRHRGSLSAYLGSSMFYRDALNGLYGFGGVYARLVLEWDLIRIGIFGIVSVLASAVFAYLGGKLDKRIGPKPVIVLAIWVLIAVCTTIVSMDREQVFGIALATGSTLPDTLFFVCGVLIGGMGGILQSSSRSLMVRHTDPIAPTESFGLYGLSGRATAFVAPALIDLATNLTGSARLGVSPIVLLFILGLFLLYWVRPEGDQN